MSRLCGGPELIHYIYVVRLRKVIHLVCFISNCVIEQPVDAFQSLMVVAYRLLIFRKKILMVVAYF